MNKNYLELNDFLSTHIFNNIDINKKHTKFSSTSNIMLNQIYRIINRAENIYNIKRISTELLELNKLDLPKGNSYSYYPVSIRNEVDKMQKMGCKCTFTIHIPKNSFGKQVTRSFTVYFICSNKTDNVIRYMKNSIKQIYMWLFVASYYARVECSQSMNIYLYLTKLPKMLPEKGIVVGRPNVNTAFTTSCKPVTEINIFREEEWFKTFIHETFHSMGLDFSEFDNQDVDKQIFTMFPVDIDVRLYETYCEMWGELMNIMFSSYNSMRHNTGVENMIDKIPQMIKKTELLVVNEIKHSLFQATKLLSHYDITYMKLIGTNRNSSNENLSCNYKEETQALSYYVIKSVLLFHINTFINWCARHNNLSINFTNITNGNITIEDKMNDYCELVREHYLSSDYVNAMKQMHELFHSIKKTNRNKYALQNLRMTITNF